ncbi:MAG: hypothetical protein ABL921_19600 [Pirellula sp.]
MKHISKTNFKQDKLYPSVVRAVDAILERSSFVAPVDVLIESQRLDKKHYEDWRFCRVPYLERVTQSGLGNLHRILRILELHCRELGLSPSKAVYKKWGKGKSHSLRFSKSGDPNIENSYATHWIRKQPTTIREAIPRDAQIPINNSAWVDTKPDPRNSPIPLHRAGESPKM